MIASLDISRILWFARIANTEKEARGHGPTRCPCGGIIVVTRISELDRISEFDEIEVYVADVCNKCGESGEPYRIYS